MATNTVQRNVLDEMQAIGLLVIQLKSRLRNVVEMYGNENIASLVDADIQELPTFAHVTVSELTGAKNGFDAVATAIGEYVATTPATKILKIVPNVPH